MVMARSARTAVPAGLLAVACSVLGTGCGEEGGSGGTAQGQPRVVFFSSAPRGPLSGHEVLGDRTAAVRYADAFAERDPQARAQIVAAAQGTDFGRQVLVGWTEATGCSAATGAALGVSGNRLELRVSQPEPPQECLATYRVSVVFRVDREQIPERPEFG
jgi:hypothetical protein